MVSDFHSYYLRVQRINNKIYSTYFNNGRHKESFFIFQGGGEHANSRVDSFLNAVFYLVEKI